MRLLQATSALAFALSANACGNPGAAQHPDAAFVACEVAAAYAESVIAEAKGKPLVFTTDDASFSSPVIGGEWWNMNGERPHSVNPPPAALIKRLKDQGNRNAVPRCASVRKVLDDRRIAYGSKAVDAVNSPDPSKPFKATIQTISVPVVSTDRQWAVLASSGVSGALAGGGFLQLLALQADGKWKVVAFSLSWVA